MIEPRESSREKPRVQWGPEAAFLLIALDFSLILFLPSRRVEVGAVAARFALAFLFTALLLTLWKARPAAFGVRVGRLREGFKAVLLAVGLTAILLGVGTGVFFLLRAFGVHLTLPPPSGWQGPAHWKAILMTVLVYPVLEEWIYRGVLFPPLETRIGRWGAILLSGLIFQALHLAYGVWWPHYFVGGMILAWAFARSGSLLYPIFLHGLWNLFVVGVDIARSEGWLRV